MVYMGTPYIFDIFIWSDVAGWALMKGMNIQKDIPAYVTKLKLGHRVGFMSSLLTTDKLFPGNPRAITGPPKISLLLVAKKHACIDHQTKAYPCYAHWPDVRSKPQQDCQKAKCYAKAFLYCTAEYSNWLDVSGKLSYSHTSLELPEPSKWLPAERSDLSYLSALQQQPILSQEHQSSGGQVFHHVHGLGRQPTDRNQRQLRSHRLQLHDGSWS